MQAKLSLTVESWGIIMALVAAGCAGEAGNKDKCVVDTTYNPVINSADFVTTIDNPFFPLTPGTTYTYQSPTETVTVTVTSDTRAIEGIAATVVRDTVTVDGAMTEDTYDWYAQDTGGSVWYLGEDTKEYENGVVVSTAGSWEAGVNNAKPGYAMLASPQVGDTYRQEYSACNAEDQAQVVSLDETVSVPYGDFTGCLKTLETTPLEPDLRENKYYCSGVGNVLEVDLNTGERTELISITP